MVSFFCYGTICAESNDSISLKIRIPADLSTEEPVLVIQNNYAEPIIVRFYYDNMRDLAAPDIWRETFFYVKSLNLSSNKEEEDHEALTFDHSLSSPYGVMKVVKAGSTYEITLPYISKYFNKTKYRIIDSYVNLRYIKVSDIGSGKENVKMIKNIVFENIDPE